MHDRRRRIIAGALWLVLFPALAGGAAVADEASTPGAWLAKAEGFAVEVEHPDGHAALLVSVGTGYVEAGLLAQARPLLRAAVDYGWECRGCYAKARRLADLGVLQDEAGDALVSLRTFVLARAACDEIEDVLGRARAIAYLAGRRVEAEGLDAGRYLFEEALEEAEAVPWPRTIDALIIVGVEQAAAGDVGGTEQTLYRLRALPGAHSGDRHAAVQSALDEIESEVVLAAIDRGDLESARAHAKEVRDVGRSASLLAALARAEAEAGKPAGEVEQMALFTPALEAAMRLPETVRGEALLEVVDAALASGCTAVLARARPGIRAGIRGMKDAVSEVSARIAWARLERLAGRGGAAFAILGEAGRVVGGVTSHPDSDPLRRRLAVAWARAGHVLRAEVWAARIVDPMEKANARLAIAEVLAAEGRGSCALVMCRALLRRLARWPEDEVRNRAEVLRRIAVLQAACGRYDEAAKTVDAIDGPFHAATACTYIARDLTS